MIFERFDVVTVPFPFVDRDAAKRRPALVVSSSPFTFAHPAAILAMITTASGSVWPSDVAIDDLGAAGLKNASVVRMKLFTLDKKLILRRIGRLAAKDRKAVDRMLRDSLSARS